MRLIDADVENSKLLDFIAEHNTSIQYALEHRDMTILEDIFFEYFEAQKIAYDVDRVVEKLEHLSENEEYNDLNTYEEKAAYNTAYLKAIEIVKAGGING